MQFDRYRWQDRVFDSYRWSIDVAVTTLFVVALSASAVIHLTGDQRRPDTPRAFIAQSAAKPAQQPAGQARPAAELDCDPVKVLSQSIRMTSAKSAGKRSKGVASPFDLPFPARRHLTSVSSTELLL